MAGADGRVLFELAGAEPRRFSPFCWRARFALAHKGLEAKLEPVRFCDKGKLAASGQTLVPVLVDGARIVHDSFAIACYLATPIRTVRRCSAALPRVGSRSSSIAGGISRSARI